MPLPHLPAEISTERLLIRAFTGGDAEFVLALHQEPELLRFIPSAQLVDLAGAWEWIERAGRDLPPGWGWRCVTRHDGTPVGTVVLKGIPASSAYPSNDVEIGWRQRAEHGGRGYATEAAAGLLAAAHAAGVDRVVAVTDPANTASQAVCRRIGMTALGRSDVYYDRELALFEAVRGVAQHCR